MRKHRGLNGRGITFVELMMSMFLINLVVLILIALLSGGLSALSRAHNQDVAVKLAKAKIEEMLVTRYDRLSTVALASQVGDGVFFSGSFAEFSSFRYRIEVTPSEAVPSGTEMTPPVPGLSTVRVFVRGPYRGTAQAMGYTEVQLAVVVAPPVP